MNYPIDSRYSSNGKNLPIQYTQNPNEQLLYSHPYIA